MLHRAALPTALGLCLAALVHSAPVSAPRALRVALTQLGQSGLPPVVGEVRAISLDSQRQDSDPVLWLATFQGGGFAFIRADDLLPPLAAWSQEGLAPVDMANPALADWLNLQRLDLQWARQMNWRHPQAATAWQSLEAGLVQREGEHVDPLLSCTWDQGWPWNQFCPADAAGPGGHVWAGCVATAMAQVMYFWRWPDMGAGYHSYNQLAYGPQTANFSATTYDWNAMHDSQGTAAAALLQYHCGVSVEMEYSPSGSGAWVGGDHPYTALEALKTNFRYPSRANYLTHQQLPGSAWGDRLAQEILAGRPVLDSGYGSGGHAFVLDGLDNGLFHLNWGWSGWFNGYYDVEALTPGGMEFSLWQGAIVDLMADTAPVVSVPNQSVALGQNFAVVNLASVICDAEDSLHTLECWVDAAAPLTAVLDMPTQQLLVQAPLGWTGSALLSLCALDPQGLWTCGESTFTVHPAALAPRPVDDLRLSLLPNGLRLNWTLPTQDLAGAPFTPVAVRIHGSTNPWFQPGMANLLGSLPGTATQWTEPVPSAGTPRFYRVVVE